MLSRFTFEQARDGILWIDAHARFVDANRAACERLGYSRDELLDRRVFDIDAVMTEADWAAHWAELRANGTGRLESRHRCRDGTEFPVEITCHFIRIHGHELNCVFVRDVTADKEQELQILRSHQWLDVGAEAAGLGFWDWNLRDATKICSKQYYRNLGWSEATFNESFETYRDLVHPEDREAANRDLDRHLAGETPMVDSEYRFRTEDGRWIWILDRGRVVERDEAGRPIRIAGVIQDITPRKLIERRTARLAELDRICQSIAASFADQKDLDQAISSMLRDVGSFLDVSRSYVFALHDDGRIMDNTHEWCNEGVKPQRDSLQGIDTAVLEPILRTMRECRPIVIGDIDSAHLKPSVREHFTSQSIRALVSFPFFVDGQMRGFIGFDETRKPREWLGEEIALLQAIVESFARGVEQRAAHEAQAAAKAQVEQALLEAESANRARDAFLAHMSHELRTPLTAVLGFAEILERESLDAETRRLLVSEVGSNGRRLLNIINDILDLTRIEAGELMVERSTIDLAPLLNHAARLIRPAAERKELQLRVRVTGRVPRHLDTDESRMLQILANLLSNAVKFTDSGYVGIVASHENGSLRLTVEDTGAGIPAQRIHTVFEPFESSVVDCQGVGLGLPICRRLAKLLGGRLDCRSEVGRGSQFTLVLPASCDGPWLEECELGERRHTLQDDVTGSRPTALLEGVRVLLAEDSIQNRRVIEFFLQEQGAEVRWCADGVEALARMRAAAQEIDLVLMDMGMPVMNGYAATSAARAEGFSKPIIAITAHSSPQDRARCLQAGCDEHVSKPIDSRRLVEVCRRFAGVDAPAAPPPASGPSTADRFRVLVADYLVGLAERREAIERAWSSGAFDELRTLAHQVAGSAGSYGLPELSRVARACEQAIRSEAATPEIERSVAVLGAELRSAEATRAEDLELPAFVSHQAGG